MGDRLRGRKTNLCLDAASKDPITLRGENVDATGLGGEKKGMQMQSRRSPLVRQEKRSTCSCRRKKEAQIQDPIQRSRGEGWKVAFRWSPSNPTS